MNRDVLEYIKTQRVCVLAVEMPDGSPHAATVHFAHSEDPLAFIFETHRDYRKSEALFGRAETRASVVVGFEEGKATKTLQLDGTVRLLSDEDAALQEVYLAKFPEKKEKAKDPKAVFFKFIPAWWRFTDWGGPNGKTIITSDQNS